jgi:hypothetical protein
MKQCFKNSTTGMWDGWELEYYEGYAFHTEIQFAFMHAWNVKDGKVIDLTLKNPEEYEYYGVKFTPEQIWKEQLKHGVYGMLDIGPINVDLIRSIDEGLVEEALQISRQGNSRDGPDGVGEKP